MALTITETAQGFIGNVGHSVVWRTFDVVGPASMASNGELLTAADMKLSKILLVVPQSGLNSPFQMLYDYTNQKLIWGYLQHLHVENTSPAYVQNASTNGVSTIGLGFAQAIGMDVSANTVRIFVVGMAP